MTEARRLLSDPLLFTQYMFKMNGREFVVSDHHIQINEVLKRVLTLDLTRVIINMPPRYTKTELAVKNFMAVGLALNPKSKFIHLSYSDKLALDNSKEVRDIVKSDYYQKLFGIKLKKDTDAKAQWDTELGGGVYATSIRGQVTGFGAGDFEGKTFCGAMIIDDPNKLTEIHSMIIREEVNSNFDGTIRSRINSEKTPIIIIQQRGHKNDLSGYLLDKEPDVWYHLNLPAIKNDGTPLFPQKHTIEQLNHLNKINHYVFQTQYMQNPVNIKTGGEFWKDFEPNTHIAKIDYSNQYPLHISIDNNVYPYISISIWQIKDKREDGGLCELVQIGEIPAKEPNNTVIKAARLLIKYLRKLRYQDIVYIYGDKTTKNRNTIDDDHKSFLDKFVSEIEDIYPVRVRMPSKNPNAAMAAEFINSIYSENYAEMDIKIDQSCVVSIDDYIQTKVDQNGNILKRKVKDPKNNITYEEHGHYSDTLKDFVCEAFKEEFRKFRRGIGFGEEIDTYKKSGGGSRHVGSF